MGLEGLSQHEKLEVLAEQGEIVFSDSGFPRYKQRPTLGIPHQDIWAYQPYTEGLLIGSKESVDKDIKWLEDEPERLGYQTQKPEGLLERIVSASSNPGDIVLDPFCGCGTAVVAAHRLGRQWVGIDITWLAVALMRNRLTTTFPGDFPNGIPVDGEPADEAAALALAERDKYQFQFWAVGKLGGTSRGGENRKGRDRGIDGVMTFPEMDPNRPSPVPEYKQVIISVKGGATGPAHVRELVGTVEREKAALGVLVVTQAPTQEMEREAASAGLYHSTWDGSTFPKIQILTAAEVVHGVTVEMPPQRLMPQYEPAPRAKRRALQGRLEV